MPFQRSISCIGTGGGRAEARPCHKMSTLESNSPVGLPIVLQIIGIALLGVTGWLGGELVDRHGIGVDPGANVNSPSSLSGKPADANESGTERLQEREAVG